MTPAMEQLAAVRADDLTRRQILMVRHRAEEQPAGPQHADDFCQRQFPLLLRKVLQHLGSDHAVARLVGQRHSLDQADVGVDLEGFERRECRSDWIERVNFPAALHGLTFKMTVAHAHVEHHRTLLWGVPGNLLDEELQSRIGRVERFRCVFLKVGPDSRLIVTGMG